MANLKRNAEPQTRAKSKRSKSLIEADAREHADDAVVATPRIEDPATQDDDEETGTLNEAAKLVQKLAQQGTGKDPWPRTFSKKLKDDQIEVLRRLGAARRNIATDRASFEDQFLTLLATALAPADAEDNFDRLARPFHITNFAAEHQELYNKSKLLLRKCSFLVQEYNRLSQRNYEPSRLVELKKEFEDGRAVTASAIAAGRKVAQSDIDGLLADKHHEVRAHKELDAEAQQYGRALLAYGDNEEQRHVAGWGTVAHKVHKAAEKMQDIAIMEE